MANNCEISFAPTAFVTPSSNYPKFNVGQNGDYLEFNKDTTQTAYSRRFICPAGYTGLGTLKADIAFYSDATSGNVDWEVAVEAVAAGEALDLSAASSFAAASAVNAAVNGTAGRLVIATVTIANKDSLAAGYMTRFSIVRDADDGTNDTANGYARVTAARFYEEA